MMDWKVPLIFPHGSRRSFHVDGHVIVWQVIVAWGAVAPVSSYDGSYDPFQNCCFAGIVNVFRLWHLPKSIENPQATICGTL